MTTLTWQRRWSGVTFREIAALAEAQAVLLSCQLAKWRRPLGGLIEWGAEDGGSEDRLDGREIEAVCWAVTRAARYGVFRPQCLVRSLAIQRMLRRRGIPAGSMRIGVRMRNGSFQAHAWVELRGAVLGDSPAHVRSFTQVTDLRLVEL